VLLGVQALCIALLGFVLFVLLGLPKELGDAEALSTASLFTAGGLLAYVVAPFFFGLPYGRSGFLRYLGDIRLTRVRPLFRLLALTLSCQAILVACQGAGSLVYRWAEGGPVTAQFAAQVFDLSQALPPDSMLLFAMFYSSFEEVAFRGVLLTMLLEKHAPRRAILYSAIAFGAAHLPAVFAGRPPVLTLGQVVWAFLFGLFYGYLFVRTGSLLPPMIIHWLSNVFQAPLTAGWLGAPPAVSALYGVVFGYGLAALLMTLWVRFFADRWLPAQDPLGEGRAGERPQKNRFAVAQGGSDDRP
jgi:membrane protease YdiL (CAAX protease family)